LERTLVERTPGGRACAGRTHAQPPLPYELPAWQPEPPRRTAAGGRACGPYLPVRRDRPTRVSDAAARKDSALQAPGSQEASRARRARVAGRGGLRRAVRVAGGAAVFVGEGWAGRPGVALLMLAVVLPLLAVPSSARRGWPLVALARVLGLIGLAGAYPAVA